MNILVLNCGSSSIKYQLLDMSGEPDLKAKGLVERIGLEKGILTHKAGGKKHVIEEEIPDHTYGIKLVLDLLVDKQHGVINSLNELYAVGHRVAHGGDKFSKSVVIDDQAIAYIQSLCEIAPLHNPANLLGIEAIKNILPNIPQVATFDTAFHQTMPEEAFNYAIPRNLYENNKIRRYGFHGTSHYFVSKKACEMLNWDITTKKIVTCHLGNGASITAIDKGRSVDTSMGFTPVEGLVMGTRVGDIDAGAVFYIMEKENLDVKSANTFFNKKCGLTALSNGYSDMRDICNTASEGNKYSKLALNSFVYRVKKYIGAYATIMNGLDLVIMTGGIGENAFGVRNLVFQNMEFLGIDFDAKKNDNLIGEDAILSKENSKVKVMTICTDEELVIATDTLNLTKKK